MWLREGIFIACVCLLVIIFQKQMGPDQARQNTEFLNESKQMAYLNIFFGKSIIK